MGVLLCLSHLTKKRWVFSSFFLILYFLDNFISCLHSFVLFAASLKK